MQDDAFAALATATMASIGTTPVSATHQRLGGGVHADAIMDRIVHNTIWITTGDMNMREHVALSAV